MGYPIGCKTVCITNNTSQLAVNGPCTVYGIIDAVTGVGTVTVYDNTAASGSIIAAATTGTNSTNYISMPSGVKCSKGVYVSIVTGTHAAVTVIYDNN